MSTKKKMTMNQTDDRELFYMKINSFLEVKMTVVSLLGSVNLCPILFTT